MFWRNRNRIGTHGKARVFVAGLAALVLCAQLAAIGHYHQTDGRRLAAQSAFTVDDGLCPLCILAFHLPLNPAAQPTVVQPHTQVRPAQSAGWFTYVSQTPSPWLTRAPPPSV
jgi:Protein of unknown function (DUF2946)